jgi:hypothetical protein
VEFVQRHLGDEFDNTIASVRLGFFVLLVVFRRGTGARQLAGDDYYLFLEDQYAGGRELTPPLPAG